MKNFDIVQAAQGVDKEFVKEFKSVVIRNKTLEIRFHWSGKGTTAAPARGTYGPLISAISVKASKLYAQYVSGEIFVFFLSLYSIFELKVLCCPTCSTL